MNVKTTGEPKPVVKWRTKVVEKLTSTGYPKVRSISRVSDDESPVTPLSKVDSYGK